MFHGFSWLRNLWKLFGLIADANHLGTALLGLLLLPYFSKVPAEDPAAPRLVVVTSEVHHLVPKLDEALVTAPRVLEKLSDKQYCTPEYVQQPLISSLVTNTGANI